MKKSTKDKIQESIEDLKRFGGIRHPNVKKAVSKLKKALKDEEKYKK